MHFCFLYKQNQMETNKILPYMPYHTCPSLPYPLHNPQSNTCDHHLQCLTQNELNQNQVDDKEILQLLKNICPDSMVRVYQPQSNHSIYLYGGHTPFMTARVVKSNFLLCNMHMENKRIWLINLFLLIDKHILVLLGPLSTYFSMMTNTYNQRLQAGWKSDLY